MTKFLPGLCVGGRRWIFQPEDLVWNDTCFNSNEKGDAFAMMRNKRNNADEDDNQLHRLR